MSEEREPEILMPDEEPEVVREAKQETALAAVAEQSALDMLQTLDNAMAIIERRAEVIERAHLLGIRATDPADWVLFRDKQGNEVGMITKDGAAKVAPLYGIRVTNLRPIDGQGNWKPDRKTDQGKVTLSGSCDARSEFTGREVFGLSGSRSSAESFTGRTDSSHGSYAGDAVAEADLKSALHTLLTVTKPVRVLAGLSRVPKSELDAAWEGTPKSSAQCRKGSGYGSSSERGAQSVAEEGVGEAANELGNEVLRRVRGSKEDAKKLLKEITANPPKFDGFDTVSRFTKSWQVRNAWEKLTAHPVFGDAAQREPGSDDVEG